METDNVAMDENITRLTSFAEWVRATIRHAADGCLRLRYLRPDNLGFVSVSLHSRGDRMDAICLDMLKGRLDIQNAWTVARNGLKGQRPFGSLGA